jgi:hypothetical protein
MTGSRVPQIIFDQSPACLQGKKRYDHSDRPLGARARHVTAPDGGREACLFITEAAAIKQTLPQTRGAFLFVRSQLTSWLMPANRFVGKTTELIANY